MSTLQFRAAELIASGYRPVPVKEKKLAYAGDTPERDYAPEHFIDGMRIQVRAGLQKDGRYLYGYDLEGPSHGPTFDADREWEALESALPHVARKLARVRSTTGDGWWLIFRCHKTLHSGPLFQDGRKIGDFIGNGGTQRVPDFGEAALQTLTLTEIEHLLDFWTVRNADPNGESWTARGRQGANYAAGYKRIHPTKADLRNFLIALNIKTSLRLADKLTTAVKGERSNEAGNLMQCLMFNVHKLTKTTDFSTNCRTAMAYWMVANSFGKADDTDHNQEKDGFSLVAKIIHEDPILAGGSWTAPFWAKGNTATTAPAPHPAPEAPRPAHRPAGDRAKQIARLKRLLTYQWEATVTGKFYYFADDLDDWAERCSVSRRSIQSYLTDLENDAQITRGQESGRAGGRPWMQIEPAFFGMQITPEEPSKAVPEPDKIGAFRNADPIAEQGILTPQTVELTPVCKVDHQNTCIPVATPAAPAADEWAGIDDEIAKWEATTRDGRHFAKLRGQQEATAESIAQLCGVLRPAHRDLVSQVRKAARRANEPDWWQRDYAAMDTYALTVELRRLQAPAAAPVGAHSAGDPLSGSGVQQAFLERLQQRYPGARILSADDPLLLDGTDTTFTTFSAFAGVQL